MLLKISAQIENPNDAAHEWGHNLGITHQGITGLMTKNANSDRIWKEYFNDILGQAGIGSMKKLKDYPIWHNNSEEMGKPIGSDYNRLKGNSIYEETGDRPSNFLNGEVKEK